MVPNVYYSLRPKKKASQFFIDTDVPITKMCLYTSKSRENREFFLGTERVYKNIFNLI
jgi:hypothetical protein